MRALPRVDDLALRIADEYPALRRHEILSAARKAIDDHRGAILNGQVPELETLADSVLRRATALLTNHTQSAPRRVINGTGIIVHTGLGRSLLARSAAEAVARVASSHCALEVDIASGERGHRDAPIAELLREVTGCEDATVVNNCAGATLIALNSLARDKDVICSRGELVEIGGGFRMPDVMAQSGCHLKEVGTTNKTRLSDYEAAIGESTGAILKVHTSNYRVIGFTSEVPLAGLVALGRSREISVIEDLGSGVLLDLTLCGLPYEPRVQDSVATRADIVCFSGDKLLGGPQCGILVGRKAAIAQIRQNPMMRALRVDKFTLAALEATLRLYRDEDEAWREIPTLLALRQSVETVKKRAQKLKKLIGAVPAQINVVPSEAQAGAGALPTATVPSFALRLRPQNLSLDDFARRLRLGEPSVWGYIREDAFWLDCRTLRDEELPECAVVVKNAVSS